MTQLKWYGIKWGILKQSDLPDVETVEYLMDAP